MSGASEIIDLENGVINEIQFAQSTFKFPNGRGQIDYRCAAGTLNVWNKALLKSPPFVHLTTLEVSSGGGKTTLMNLIHTFLSGQLTDQNIRFVPHTKIRHAVSYIPQRANTVRHWRVSALLSRNYEYIGGLFDEEIQDEFYSRNLSSFSGGQIARILVASALERLQESGARANYLLLDEAFEGIDSSLLTNSLNRIATIWAGKNHSRHLFIVLVTHLNVALFESQISKNLVSLNRIILKREPSEIKDRFERIPVDLQVVERAG